MRSGVFAAVGLMDRYIRVGVWFVGEAGGRGGDVARRIYGVVGRGLAGRGGGERWSLVHWVRGMMSFCRWVGLVMGLRRRGGFGDWLGKVWRAGERGRKVE